MPDRSGLQRIVAAAWILFALLMFLMGPWAVGSPDDIDLSVARYAPPGTISKVTGKLYWLGTDAIGRDIAAGIVNGFRISLGTAMMAVAIMAAVGIPIGLLSGYTGAKGVRLTIVQVVALFVFLFFGIYLLSYISVLPWYCVFFAVVLFVIVWMSFRVVGTGVRTVGLPLDMFIMRGVEVVSGLPGLVVLLAISGVFQSKSMVATALVIGLLRWPLLTVIARNETLKVKEWDYIKTGKALGYSSLRVLVRHILPNIKTPLFVALLLGMASSIMIESALSFLGIGVALETQTWGSIMAQSRLHIKAWWMAVLPGLCIFLTVYSLHILSRRV